MLRIYTPLKPQLLSDSVRSSIAESYRKKGISKNQFHRLTDMLEHTLAWKRVYLFVMFSLPSVYFVCEKVHERNSRELFRCPISQSENRLSSVTPYQPNRKNPPLRIIYWPWSSAKHRGLYLNSLSLKNGYTVDTCYSYLCKYCFSSFDIPQLLWES